MREAAAHAMHTTSMKVVARNCRRFASERPDVQGMKAE